MDKYFFVKSILRHLSNGLTFKKICAFFLKIAAVVVILAGLVGWIYAWKAIFTSDVTGIIPGGIGVQILAVVFLYMVVHNLMIRAADVEKNADSGYTVMSITSIILKLVGEIYAWFLAFAGIAGGLFAWISGKPLSLLFNETAPFIPVLGEATFLGGVTAILAGAAWAFVSLVAFYFLSELVSAVIHIAKR
ncbi:MAG: hypothetical protein ACM3WV_11385 [Bacillota bacterium]